MAITFLGTDHREVSLADLDLLEQKVDAIKTQLSTQKPKIGGFVTIQTCNRFEIYVDADDSHEATGLVLDAVAGATGLSVDYCRQVFKIHTDTSAAQHLFSVAGGLESMVIGEEEIAGQVRKAFSSAQENAQATTPLVQLFQKTSNVAKKITHETGLGAAGRSTITVALDLLEKKFGSHAGKRALVIGTGAHARVVVAALLRAGIAEILVASNSGRAKDFAATRGLTAIEPGEISSVIAKVDLVITCSGSSGQVIDKQLIQNSGAIAQLMIVDVALSHDVASNVAELENVELVNLETIKHHAPREHGEAILHAQEIVANAVNEYQAELLQRNLDPFVTAIKRKLTLWIDEEVDRVEIREGAAAAAGVRESLQAMANQMLHEPLTTAKALAATGDEDNYRKALLVLFGERNG